MQTLQPPHPRVHEQQSAAIEGSVREISNRCHALRPQKTAQKSEGQNDQGSRKDHDFGLKSARERVPPSPQSKTSSLLTALRSTRLAQTPRQRDCLCLAAVTLQEPTPRNIRAYIPFNHKGGTCCQAHTAIPACSNKRTSTNEHLQTYEPTNKLTKRTDQLTNRL